jgi:hypothetical protein
MRRRKTFIPNKIKMLQKKKRKEKGEKGKKPKAKGVKRK